MKKVLLVVIIATAFFQLSFASSDKNVHVTPEALSSFQKDFILTSNVKWEQRQDVYLVNFTQMGEQLTAYYSSEGELQGYSKVIAVQDLTPQVSRKLETRFAGSNITQLLKYYSIGDEATYFIRLETNQVVSFIRAHMDGTFKILKQSKK